MAVRVTEICKITPPPHSLTESSLPLTFFDTFWLKFHPVERIFFYELTTDSSSFFSSILPRLKQSLSLTLLHFLPFAGNLIWPSKSDRTFIFYTPGDGISFTVADSDADFHSLSGDTIREIHDSHNYVPELNVTETEAETMSLQITFFPNKGFCIGISSHHAIFDGKSIILFIKSWAYICKQTEKANGNATLPPELTPFLDRTVIPDPQGLDMVYLNEWKSMASKSGTGVNPRSLKLYDIFRLPTDTNIVRGTFKLSGEDIKKINQKALSHQLATNEANRKCYSIFVLTYAYVSIAIAKAKRLEKSKKFILAFAADVRTRLDPPVHVNYCGNCVIPNFLRTEVGFVIKEDGLTFLAEELTQLVKGLESGALNGVKEKLEVLKEMDPTSTAVIGVAGSPRFEVYGTDFGWGTPNRVEVTSIDRGTSISMAERRDGNGGVEVGVVLKKDEMNMFQSLFLGGLKDLYV